MRDQWRSEFDEKEKEYKKKLEASNEVAEKIKADKVEEQKIPATGSSSDVKTLMEGITQAMKHKRKP